MGLSIGPISFDPIPTCLYKRYEDKIHYHPSYFFSFFPRKLFIFYNYFPLLKIVWTTPKIMTKRKTLYDELSTSKKLKKRESPLGVSVPAASKPPFLLLEGPDTRVHPGLAKMASFGPTTIGIGTPGVVDIDLERWITASLLCSKPSHVGERIVGWFTMRGRTESRSHIRIIFHALRDLARCCFFANPDSKVVLGLATSSVELEWGASPTATEEYIPSKVQFAIALHSIHPLKVWFYDLSWTLRFIRLWRSCAIEQRSVGDSSSRTSHDYIYPLEAMALCHRLVVILQKRPYTLDSFMELKKVLNYLEG